MRSITVRNENYIRDVEFIRIGNGPALRMSGIMQSVGAMIGTRAKIYRVEGGFYVRILRAKASKRNKSTTGKSRFDHLTSVEELMSSFDDPACRLQEIPLSLTGLERP